MMSCKGTKTWRTRGAFERGAMERRAWRTAPGLRTTMTRRRRSRRMRLSCTRCGGVQAGLHHVSPCSCVAAPSAEGSPSP